jgi:hypothetical protein
VHDLEGAVPLPAEAEDREVLVERRRAIDTDALHHAKLVRSTMEKS